jgi:diguanylate cyclase
MQSIEIIIINILRIRKSNRKVRCGITVNIDKNQPLFSYALPICNMAAIVNRLQQALGHAIRAFFRRTASNRFGSYKKKMNNPLPHGNRTTRAKNENAGIDKLRSAGPSTSSQRRSASLVCLLIALVTAAMIPVSTVELPHIPAFLPAYQTILITAYLITAYLVFAFYRANKSIALLYLCAGCIYTAVILAAQFLSFPNLLVTKSAPLGGPQTTIWLWCFWHAAPPLAVAGYALSEWRRPGMVAADPYRTACRFAIALAVALTLSIAAVTLFHDRLPILEVDGDFQKTATTGIAPAIQAIGLIALLLLWRATGFHSAVNIWLGVTLVALLLDSAITMTGGSRPSVGWYAGRMNALLSAVIMLLIYLREINCVYVDTVLSARQLAASHALLEVKMDQVRLDSLTGLPGRALFLEQAKALHASSVVKGTAVAFLFIDLDGFKEVNDRMGHEQGDAVLKQTADVLVSVLRDTDVAGRVGGDEFVVSLVAPGYAIQATATAVADRIVRKISEIGYGIGCSVGISLCSSDGLLLETSLRQADAAMYEAKKNGKNRFVLHVPKAA